MANPGGQTKWYRDCFFNHPLFSVKGANRPIEVFANARQDKTKCICKYCLDDHVAKAMAEDARQQQTGELAALRDRDTIIASCT